MLYRRRYGGNGCHELVFPAKPPLPLPVGKPFVGEAWGGYRPQPASQQPTPQGCLGCLASCSPWLRRGRWYFKPPSLAWFGSPKVDVRRRLWTNACALPAANRGTKRGLISRQADLNHPSLILPLGPFSTSYRRGSLFPFLSRLVVSSLILICCSCASPHSSAWPTTDHASHNV